MIFAFCPKQKREHNKKESSSGVDLFKIAVFTPVNITGIHCT